MQLVSPVFNHGDTIPDLYTCKGSGLHPPLLISDVPEATQSLALYVHDPDSPGKDFVHWIIWNISATTTTIPEGRTPTGATEGVNDFGNVGWGGPCPHQGSHRYVFELYALNRELTLPSGAHAFALLDLLKEHGLAKAQLIGLVTA